MLTLDLARGQSQSAYLVRRVNLHCHFLLQHPLIKAFERYYASQRLMMHPARLSIRQKDLSQSTRRPKHVESRSRLAHNEGGTILTESRYRNKMAW